MLFRTESGNCYQVGMETLADYLKAIGGLKSIH